jgi:hypothetical protein
VLTPTFHAHGKDQSAIGAARSAKIEREMTDEAEIVTGSAFRFNSCAFSAMLVSEPMPL